jgi:medium-chain acyl-[acyl-carrier-protein] hydrolase
LARLGGTPAEVLSDRDLMNAFLPAVRADFVLASAIRRPEGAALATPFSLFRGVDDESLGEERLAQWRMLTTGPVETHVLGGGHFYPPVVQGELIRLIGATLARDLALKAPPQQTNRANA